MGCGVSVGRYSECTRQMTLLYCTSRGASGFVHNAKVFSCFCVTQVDFCSLSCYVVLFRSRIKIFITVTVSVNLPNLRLCDDDDRGTI